MLTSSVMSSATYVIITYTHACNTYILTSTVHVYSNKYNNGTMCQSIYICYCKWTSIVVAPAMEQCVNLPEDNFMQQKSIVYDSSDSVEY